MTHLVYGAAVNGRLLDWAAKRIRVVGTAQKFGPAIAMGFATGASADDHLMAVGVFHEYHPQFSTVQFSLASDDPRFATRANFKSLFAVPFIQYRCNKVWCAVPHTARRTIGLSLAFGFTKEATLADHFGPGLHAVICRMSAADYEAIYLKRRRKVRGRATRDGNEPARPIAA